MTFLFIKIKKKKSRLTINITVTVQVNDTWQATTWQLNPALPLTRNFDFFLPLHVHLPPATFI